MSLSPSLRPTREGPLLILALTLALSIYTLCQMFAPEAGDAADVHSTEQRLRHIFLGPEQVDQMVRQALHFCWMSLPKERRTVDEAEKQLRRLVDRALKDFREDREAFGKSCPE